MRPTSNLARMRRQAIISRHADLDRLSLPKLCQRSGKRKVTFSTQAAAEQCRDELDADSGDGQRHAVYPCVGTDHFHLATDSHEKKAS